ncbi:MAG: YebC/PmpR family DNA-binding transcriptional regulator [Myxococcales bacterium]|nr:YebC/PmpR family DNA-binding transcriptional regulator [Myxococcales bacterium]
MSGHNKWSTIKHKKGAADAKRGKVFTKLIREITIAARLGGGDPDGNPRLRRAMDAARAANMPSDNITRAIKKGTGELEGVQYEELTYEGVGPAGTLFLLDVMTDNRNRTNPELRKVFERHNGQLGSAGSAAWAFDEKGVIQVAKDQADEETIFDAAVGAGAEDVQDLGEAWLVRTEKEDLDAVSKALQEGGMETTSVELAKLPKTIKEVGGRDAEVLVNLVEALEDHDDVQKVSSDFELSEDALAALSSQ